MGCSPSKGKLFSKPDFPGHEKALLAEPPKDVVDSTLEEEDSKCSETNEEKNELPLPTEELPIKEIVWSQLASDTTAAQNEEDIIETEVNVTPPEIGDEVVQTVQIKKKEKRKKNKTKVNFPPHMVRAHQAAYAFLNPNISKYETLLGLLDQAAQTQLSLQPMMSALVMRFEEINQALEEMAEEGEIMLKEHGDYMAMPSGMKGPVVMQAKHITATASPHDALPDLLQQLLQHSTEKMRLVGGSVQALGDTTLEEAVEYFSSLSKLLADKLQAKQAAEHTVAQVLAQVEGAAIRKSNPEDSALHSEDSGIGENESLAGSERQRNHRGSAGSGSCGSGNSIRGANDNLPSNLPTLVDHNKDEEDEDDEDEDYEDNEDARPERKRSNSSPPDPSQTLLYMCENYVKNWQSSVKRPLTAVNKPEHFSSTSCVNIMLELQKSQSDLDQKITKMVEIQSYKPFAGPHNKLNGTGQRSHSLGGTAGAQTAPLRTNQPPCSLPALVPQPPKRNTVRRLINSFSHGVDGRQGQSLANFPSNARRPKKSGTFLLSDTVNGNEGGLVINGNNNNNGWPNGKDDLDADLPPPPPEVLMDNSFQRTEGIAGNEERLQEDSVRGLPMTNQNTGVSQRLKASVQNVEVLPNRASVKPRSISILPASPVRQDAVMGAQDAQNQPETDLNTEMEKRSCLYQQARKIIHLRNAVESPDKRNIAELSSRGPSPRQARMGQRFESDEFNERAMSPCSFTVTAPPVSRVRLPPSCPSVCQRFPSPPVGRPQIISRSSSRPGSPRSLTRAADNNIEEIIPSVSFRDARSVFCLKESNSSHTCISSGSSELPITSRGRLPMRGIDTSTRRTQSEQRSSSSSNSEFPKDDCLTSNPSKERESVNTKYRPVSPLMTGDNSQFVYRPESPLMT